MDLIKYQDTQELSLVVDYTVLYRKDLFLLQSMPYFGDFIKMGFIMTVETKLIMEF